MKRLLLFAATFFSLQFVIAQEPDEEGCKDHVLLNRLPNFRIIGCTDNYNAVPVRFSAEKTEDKEGNVTRISYAFSPPDEQMKPPSPLQVVRNYENAILKNGGKKIYSSSGGDGYQGATFTMTTKDKTYWMTVDNLSPGLPDVCYGFDLYIIEMEPMKQDIAAAEMFDAISKTGAIALYINFETAKADVKAESKPTIDQLVDMLKTYPALKVSIEGHTDNTGTPAANKTLSEARARAVMKAVIASGIEPARLAAKGLGQEKPVADNRTEEGKAKNRRVEIVKM